MNRPLLPIIFVALVIALSVEARAQSHCAPNEAVYFTCRIQKTAKILSVCGSALKTIESLPNRDKAWLQYRFGPLGDPELVFPSRKAGSLDAFSHEHHKGAQSLAFSKAGVTYSVFAAQHDDTGVISKGVSVITERKVIALRCDDAIPSSEFYGLVYALEYPSTK